MILRPADCDGWLRETPEEARELLRQFPAEEVQIVRTGQDQKSDGPGEMPSDFRRAAVAAQPQGAASETASSTDP